MPSEKVWILFLVYDSLITKRRQIWLFHIIVCGSYWLTKRWARLIWGKPPALRRIQWQNYAGTRRSRSPSLGRYAKPLMPTTVTLWSMLMRKECRLCHAVADVAFLSLLLCHKAFLLRLYLDHAGYKSGSQAMSFLSYFPITALPTTIRWISLVPSKIWKIFASRMSFSTGYSRL